MRLSRTELHVAVTGASRARIAIQLGRFLREYERLCSRNRVQGFPKLIGESCLGAQLGSAGRSLGRGYSCPDSEEH
jgi:hypothetical protein